MYNPKFNSVLVQIDDADAKWGGENNEAMLGKSYSKGTIISRAECHATNEHPEFNPINDLDDMIGKQILWNEGTESGTTFEHEGKLYGFIYWFDIRAVRE